MRTILKKDIDFSASHMLYWSTLVLPGDLKKLMLSPGAHLRWKLVALMKKVKTKQVIPCDLVIIVFVFNYDHILGCMFCTFLIFIGALSI